MSNTERLSESLEDYLEAIWHLIRDKGVARSKDIADRLDVSKSSVTGALKNLAARGMVHYEAYQFVTFTDKGQQAASDIVRRHEVIRHFLNRILLIPDEAAEANACRMEHALDGDTFERLVQFVEFVLTCPRTEAGWIQGFQKYCYKGPDKKHCLACLRHCQKELEEAIQKIQEARARGTNLTNLEQGDEGRILEIQPPTALPERLKKKGLAPGSMVHVEQTCEDGRSLSVKVRGYHLDLDEAQARAVRVEKVRRAPSST